MGLFKKIKLLQILNEWKTAQVIPQIDAEIAVKGNFCIGNYLAAL